MNEPLDGCEVVIYATAFGSQILGNCFLRMAPVYMLSIGSLWTRTKVVPHWLTIVTYIAAVPFLLFAGAMRWTRFLLSRLGADGEHLYSHLEFPS